MTDLLRGYGRGLVVAFFAAVALWGAVLIVLPQLTMLDRALRAPLRQLDSAIANQVATDAATCINILERYRGPAAASEGGGIAVPSPGGMAVPSPGGMAVPSPGTTATGGAARPYILQCERTTTAQRLVRDGDEVAMLDALYDLPRLRVDAADPIPAQIASAERIRAIAADLTERLRAAEAAAFPYTTRNFEALFAARAIPMDAGTRADEATSPENLLFTAMGLRYTDAEGVVHERLGAMTLARTILFALLATALSLAVCYPIAYNLALASSGRKAVWLMVALVIPYAIVELMRVYAWLSIIDNEGLLNRLFDWVGLIDLEAGGGIAFKRYPLTVFVVIVYTYILFMVFPIVNVMSTLDRAQIEAARDLGASTWRLHARVIAPHAKPGIAVGCITTFMLSASAFSVPRIISRGLQGEWFSQTIYNKFFESGNANVGAAYAFAFTVICFAIVGLFMWAMRARLKDFVRG